ncbi:hypothetical protein L6452_05531 [Arctium lappa]|uniref:Uncharacterized protein n=1 Tax=Arctium lappa TaxID=4217 RepID=A0ACB9EH44_ARCLA|nr:hypothetical protein L6452_05531 [Arctium lappa]
MANATSGMVVHDECKLKFLDLKAKRTFRFIVYKIEEKQKQVIKILQHATLLINADMLSPDTARVRSKMIYERSKDRFKRELDDIQVELQATDPTEDEHLGMILLALPTLPFKLLRQEFYEFWYKL